MKKLPVDRIVAFSAVFVLSALLLSLFPFYPFPFGIIIALVLGAVAFEFPSVALWLAIIFSMFASFYQNAFTGVTYFIIFIFILAFTTTWIEVSLVAATWVLAYFTFPALAIVPVVVAGLHLTRENALKVGAASGISTFLLSWSTGNFQAGLMLVTLPRTDYVIRPLQNPWQFTAFLPNLDIFTSRAVMDYYAPLITNLSAFPVIVLLVIWIITGYLVAVLAGKFRRTIYGIPAAAGVLPVIVASGFLSQPSLLGLGVAVVGSVLVTALYGFARPAMAAPALRVFTGLKDLVPRGVPSNYSLLLGSPGSDERNLFLEQFIQSGLSQNAPCFCLTADVSYGRNIASKFEGLTVLICSPRAGEATEKNVVQVRSGIQNLTAINIELVNAVKERYKPGAKVCLDTVSDILLSHKLLTTRKWVSDIIPRLEGWGYTVLGVFNPALHTKEESQGIMDLFKGYIEITERELAGKARRMIAVRKMADVQYNDNELLLDRAQLRGAAKKRPSFKDRLTR